MSIPNHVIKAANRSFAQRNLIDAYKDFFYKVFYAGYKYGKSKAKLSIAMLNLKRLKDENKKI